VFRDGAALPVVLPSRLLFEGARSGAGEVADWSQAAALAGRAELVLGGGLTPGNVAEAIAAVRPFGVDVSSGVESAPGRKDPARILDFISAAREAAAGVV
jgi:phosphoribosylanthranilate isomerase